jgi:hypothetical protein
MSLRFALTAFALAIARGRGRAFQFVCAHARAARSVQQFQPRRAIDWWHGFHAISGLVSADDRGWLGSSPSTDRHRILQAENRLLKDRLRGKRIRFHRRERALGFARKVQFMLPTEWGSLRSNVAW